MAQQRSISEAFPDLSPERAYSALSIQLEKLQQLKGKDCREVDSPEKEWSHLTEKLIIRSFGSLSTNYKKLQRGHGCGRAF
jgi:hypothetical protein